MDSNYKTLNKDIQLIERDNGYWDYQIEYGDYKEATGKKSLNNALIIACLTSWNYLNRKGNPTYETFGNRAYEELKKKKSSMVEYKIRQYFIEVLNRIRRVQNVEDIQVLNSPTDMNSYDVLFTVTALNDETVKGRFTITTETGRSTSYITINRNGSTTTPLNPITYTITLTSEYGVPLPNEILHVYDEEKNILKNIGPTDENGQITYTQRPLKTFGYHKIHFGFNGNEQFNRSDSLNEEFLNIPFLFEVNDESHLILIKEKEYNYQVWIGEIVEADTTLTYDENEPLKCYLKPHGTDYTKHYYKDGEWHTIPDIYHLINKPENIMNGQIRLFIEDTDNNLYIVEDKAWIELI